MTTEIYFENYFLSGVVSSNMQNYQNAYNHLLFDYAGGTALGATPYLILDANTSVICDYFAFAIHDLTSVGQFVRVEYSNDAVSWTSISAGDYSPLGQNVNVIRFNEVSARYWRVEFHKVPNNAIIGFVAIGKRLSLPYGQPLGYKSPRFNERITEKLSKNKNGYLLGKSIIKQGFTGSLTCNFMKDTFAKNAFDQFYQHAQSKPFCFNWDAVNFPSESALAWQTKTPSIQYNSDFQDRINASFTIEGIL